MEYKILKDLPPSYTNLDYDADPVAGPSAPRDESQATLEGNPYSAPAPSAPPEAKLDPGAPGPPAYPPPPFPEPNLGPRTLDYKPPTYVFENVYEACVKYADNNCCYGKRFANQMKLEGIMSKGVFHYKLESFGEKRESAYQTIPYSGGPIDGPENGRPPDPWDVTVIPAHYFKDSQTKAQIPHTEIVQSCTDCRATGKVTCGSCNGDGDVHCFRCNGRGRDDDGTCFRCNGSGRATCSPCNGSGKVTCSDCAGYGRIKKYRLLIVTWKNHEQNFISNSYQVPYEMMLKAQGIELLSETEFELQPITNAPEPVINTTSEQYLESHKRVFPDEMIIRQRHVLRAIPFTRITYTWKEIEGEFYIYGTDEKVYFEDYPQKCCCCTCC